MNKQYTKYAGLLCLVLLIYSVGAFTRSTWYDESITIYTISKGVDFFFPLGSIIVSDLQALSSTIGSPQDVVLRLINDDVHPPLYFVSLNIWAHLFGTSLAAVRMYSVVLSVLSVVVFFRWMSDQRPSQAAWSTAIFALSGLMIGVATDARSTALVILLSVCALQLATVRNKDGDICTSVRTELSLGVVVAGLLLTHYFAALLVIPIMLHRGLMLLTKRNLKFMISPIIGFVVFLPWLPVFIEHMGARAEQGAGFGGLFAWTKVLVWRAGQLVIAPSLAEYPSVIAKLGQLGVTALVLIGGIFSIKPLFGSPARWTVNTLALFVAGVGIAVLTVLFLVTDKMMSPLRYFAVFLPSIVILSVSGIERVGEFLNARLANRGQVLSLSSIGFSLVLVMQVSMLNFGYETNAQVSGNYLRSMQNELALRPAGESLVIIDTGTGRGDLLNAAIALPSEAEAFVLSSKSADWGQQLDAFSSALIDRKEIWIAYSITRGDMSSDKSSLYPEFVQILESEGFIRRALDPDRRAMFHAVWTKPD